MKAVVIGAGFGGLAVALRLQAQGIQTTLIDKRDKPGGRAYAYEIGDYKFDGGPTVVTAPQMFEELFALCGEKIEDHVKLVPLDPFYRIYFHDKTYFDYSGDANKQRQEISKFEPKDISGYEKFMVHTKEIYQKGLVELGEQAFLSVWDMLKVAPDLLKLGAVRSVYSFVAKYFSNEKLRRVFSFHPLLIGGSPFRAPAIYTLIHTLEKDFGVHYAMGGTKSLVLALEKLFRKKGGVTLLNSEVGFIDVQDKRAKKVILKSGECFEADIVVSNGDMAHTYRNLISQEALGAIGKKTLDMYKQSMSVVVIYFGVAKKYPELKHHNIILTERYRELIEDIFENKILPDDFSIYLHVPTKTDSSLAPEGHEACYALVPVPNLDGDIKWDRIGPAFENRVLKFLDQNYMPGLIENLTVRHSINPIHFKTDLLSEKGNAFGVEPVLRQSAFFRPHNRSTIVKNLYLVGANTQPGAGMPGVLLSAKITAQLIAKDFPKNI